MIQAGHEFMALDDYDDVSPGTPGQGGPWPSEYFVLQGSRAFQEDLEYTFAAVLESNSDFTSCVCCCEHLKASHFHVYGAFHEVMTYFVTVSLVTSVTFTNC